MTATAQPSTPAPARGDAALPAALDRADGVELLGPVHGSGYREGAALVRRGDGQMVQLGPLMYALLECVDGRRSPSDLASCLSESLGKTFEEEHVARLAEKLAAQGLLAGTEENAPPRSNPLLALRWKVLVTNPALTKRLTAPFSFLFKPWVVWPVLACFFVVCWFVLVQKGVASATHQAFDKPELLLLVFALAIGSAGFHELGHASACRYGGGTPGGMGMGLYIVWPAFYTDVTDAYRLKRCDRLRTDLGGLYFNAVVAVVTMGAWLLLRVDALLLLIALQLLQMVKQLSPVIRADGYHILADITGVPDLYAHIGPTLRRLLPWRRQEPSALHGRARLVVTLWVLVVVPILFALAVGAVLVLPRLIATAWASGSDIARDLPGQVSSADVLGTLTSIVRLLALTLPVLGTVAVAQKLSRAVLDKAQSWSDDNPVRRAMLVTAALAAACGAAWAWWPNGQYQPIRADQRGTLVELVSAPVAAARPAPATPQVHLTPGTHLAISLIPVGGVTKEHPALFVLPGENGDPGVAIVSPSLPETEEIESTGDPAADPTTTTEPTTTTAPTTTTKADSAPAAVNATAFPFKLPDAPGPGGTQAVAVGTKDGGVTYKIAYSLVTVRDGAAVTNTNSAFAFASCNACTTVAVSFQVVLVVGRSNVIAPINAAGALNVDCPSCVTTAIADQIVVTLKSQPTEQLVVKLEAALRALDAIDDLGAAGSPAAIAAAVVAVQKTIDEELDQSGLVANPPRTTSTPTTPAATTTPATTTSPTSTSPAPPTTTTTETTAPTTTAATATTPPPSTTTERTTTAATTTTTQSADPPPVTTTDATSTTPG